jgi:hypothetical protein
MAIVSVTNKFLLWRFYRTQGLPVCILVALLSILFGGALVVEDAMSGESATNFLAAGVLNKIVVINLFAASLLMLCHLIYLALMAHHLVYRFPVERPQVVSLVYIVIVFAYVAHARHAYLEATGQHEVLAGAWWSSAAFAVAYFAMAFHGFMEHRAEPKASSSEGQRSTQKVRGKWMLRTDIVVCVVATLMLLRAVGLFDWSFLYHVAGVRSVASVLLGLPLMRELYAQGSPKDVIIAVALGVYVVLNNVMHRRLRDGQTVRKQKILEIQSIDSSATDSDALRTSLLENAVWLDLACGQGTNVRELIDYLYKKDTGFPKEIIYLDKDCRALIDASAASPATWPSTLKQTYKNADMRSAEGREALARCEVVHMGHTAYDPAALRAALHLLRFAKPGTLLLIRYTSNASFYRVISVSTSCGVLRPYIHHHTHKLLLEDLHGHGWGQVGADYIIQRYCDISKPEYREAVINWCDAQYGEFSGDVIERYIEGFAEDGQTRLLNADKLILLKKA